VKIISDKEMGTAIKRSLNRLIIFLVHQDVLKAIPNTGIKNGKLYFYVNFEVLSN
jgi:hypothetical protein